MTQSKVKDSIDYIISCMNKEGGVVIKDYLKMSICIHCIETNKAEKQAKKAFNKHRKKVV